MIEPHTDAYPCGCVYRLNPDRTYDHFVAPTCPFDNGKTSIVNGYRYRLWEERQQEAIREVAR